MHPTDLPARDRGSSSSVDLLVHGGDILTVDASGTIVPDGAVAVRDGRIVEVGRPSGCGPPTTPPTNSTPAAVSSCRV
ncbi:hypothetical protein GCM10010277_40290 [Streptomyces longisporoflavus]|nr:hypothetical protein GCM10010277_40290 [Streptomyces longisporoflavus]